jgi:hypothetical protein
MANYEYEYYNLSMNNIDSETNDEFSHEPDLVFNEERDSPILNNTDDYEFSIENFKLDLKTLPTFIPTIRSNMELSDDINIRAIQMNTTIYSVGIEYLHTDGNRYIGNSRVVFQPQDLRIQQPPFINGYANYKSGYYNIYNYEFFISRCINPAIKNAMIELKAVLSSYGISTTFIKNDVPYVIFDKPTQIISLLAPASNFNGQQTTVPFLSIILNKPLYRLMNTLPMTLRQDTFKTLRDGIQINITQEGFKLNLTNFGMSTSIVETYPPQIDGTNKYYATNGPEYLSIFQDYATFDSWSPVESIVFGSSSIPVKSSMRSANHSFINGIETTKGSTNIIELELTDFKSGDYTGGVIYNPSEKRWINLLQQQELKRISVNVYYRSKLNGELIPIKLNSGGSFSMKMVFRKPRYF